MVKLCFRPLFKKDSRHLGRFLWWTTEEVAYCGRNQTVISRFLIKNLHVVKNPDIFYVTLTKGGIYSNNITLKIRSRWDRGFQYRYVIFGYI